VSDDTVYRPFLTEARTAMRVVHPTVARVLDVGVWNGTHFVACEHVPAPTLDKVVAEKGPLNPHLAGQVIAQAAVALMHAHKAKLLHRDLKPANIAVFPDRRVKLLDLGLTHMLDNPWAKVTKRINLKEYAEEIAFIPPEQAWGSELDARSDIYSLGSTAYYLMTGEFPFPGTATEMMTERQLHGVPRPSLIRPGVPRELDALVAKMGAKDPHQRFQTAAECAAAFQAWLPMAEWNALGLAPVDVRTPPPRRSPGKPGAAKKQGFFGRLFGKLFGK
jgi:serine/threonine-protein kinase